MCGLVSFLIEQTLAQLGNKMAELICTAALNWVFTNFELKIDQSDAFNPFVIGIGSGSTIVPLVSLLNKKIMELEKFPNIACIPTSEQSKQLLLESLKNNYFKIGSLDEIEKIDVTIDGADAVDLENCAIVKGGGAAHCQEKIVAEASDSYIVVISDPKKLKKAMDKVVIPVEVLPIAHFSSLRILKKEFGDHLLESKIRKCPSGCGKIGPIITDNGNFIIDLNFQNNVFTNPERLDRRIRQFAGILETGLFWRLPKNTIVLSLENNETIVEYKLKK